MRYPVLGAGFQMRFTVKIISDKLLHVPETFGVFGSLLLQAK